VNSTRLEDPERWEIPCSQSQKRFWFETRLDPHNAGLNVAVRWRLEGKVVHAHLEEAWRLIIARHQTLRAAFLTIGGEPHQIVEPKIAFRVPLVDLTAMADEAAAAEAERLASLEARKTFDIAQAPLIRVTHIRVRSDVSMILITAHHTACDGWSVGILAAEMGEICAALYEGRAPALPGLPVTYADYAARERELLAAAGATHREELEQRWRGFEQFEILSDKARPPIQTSNGEIVSELLDRDLTDTLKELAGKNHCTLFMVAYAALLALLHRYSGQTDITIGTQFAGRDEVEFEPLVGTFVNTVALRTDVGGDPTFDELLERARDTVTDAYELRYVPLEELIAIVNPKRDLSRNALFTINLIFQRSFIKNETYGSFRLVDLPSRSAGSIYDLNFFMVERPEGWRASCEFNTDLYRRETVTRLLQRWITILRTIAGDRSCPISALPLTSGEERLRDDGVVELRTRVEKAALPCRPGARDGYRGPTEERLGALIAEMLGAVYVDRDADIFVLGFHSLLAMRFTARVQEMFGFELPVRAVFENPTIAAIAARIDDSQPSDGGRPATPIVKLNSGGTRTPFIYFHSDLFADGLHSRQLAAALGADQPVYAVAPHGTAGLPLLPTIESMARDYVSLIRTVQPSGPYRLGGYCASGLVAYELARLLRAEGEVVERLVLLNASPMPTRRIALFDTLIRRIGLDQRLAPRVRDRLCYNLARLHAAVLMGPRVTFDFIAKTIRSLLGERSHVPANVLEPQSFEKRKGVRETENSFAHIVASFTYHPKPHDGDATLIWGEEQQTSFDDPTKGWGSVLGHVTIESVSGGHVGAVHQRIDELARLLKTVLGDRPQ
jgi:thioesterase domain-containing protein